MPNWSSSWKSSKQPRKQRKYRYNAPMHIKQKFLHSHLSKELRGKYNRRNLGVREGDKAIIVRGRFKKLSGKVERVDLKKSKVFVAKAEITKKDGSKSFYPIEPSNLIITELNLSDKNRAKILERNMPQEASQAKKI